MNINVPVFSGFRFRAQAAEAVAQASAEAERQRDLHNRIAREVRTAWHLAAAARQRVGVAGQLLAQSNSALSLGQTCYNLGLSSIVELSQTQLQQNGRPLRTPMRVPSSGSPLRGYSSKWDQIGKIGTESVKKTKRKNFCGDETGQGDTFWP